MTSITKAVDDILLTKYMDLSPKGDITEAWLANHNNIMPSKFYCYIFLDDDNNEYIVWGVWEATDNNLKYMNQSRAIEQGKRAVAASSSNKYRPTDQMFTLDYGDAFIIHEKIPTNPLGASLGVPYLYVMKIDR